MLDTNRPAGIPAEDPWNGCIPDRSTQYVFSDADDKDIRECISAVDRWLAETSNAPATADVRGVRHHLEKIMALIARICMYIGVAALIVATLASVASTALGVYLFS